MRRAVLALLIAAPAPAPAQGTSALKHHDTNAPVDIDAQRFDFRDKDKQAIATGGVRARQGDLDLTAPTMKVFYRAQGDQREVYRVDATGGMRLVSPSETASGDFGVYDVDRRLVTITGNVLLTQGGSTLRGARLAIDLDSGRSTLDGRGGAAAPGAAGQSPGRVSAHFVVPERKPAQ